MPPWQRLQYWAYIFMELTSRVNMIEMTVKLGPSKNRLTFCFQGACGPRRRSSMSNTEEWRSEGLGPRSWTCTALADTWTACCTASDLRLLVLKGRVRGNGCTLALLPLRRGTACGCGSTFGEVWAAPFCSLDPSPSIGVSVQTDTRS